MSDDVLIALGSRHGFGRVQYLPAIFSAPPRDFLHSRLHLTLIDLEALEGATNRFVADQMWSDTFRETGFRRQIGRPGRDRMTKRPG
jgi:hypothetical protein